MAYIARPKVDASGLYGFLLGQEQKELDRWNAGQQVRVRNGCTVLGYPRQRRLDAFAAGRPVDVSSGEIWGWNAVQAGAPRIGRPVGQSERLPERAIVRPDDTITFSDDWAALFIEEHGL